MAAVGHDGSRGLYSSVTIWSILMCDICIRPIFGSRNSNMTSFLSYQGSQGSKSKLAIVGNGEYGISITVFIQVYQCVIYLILRPGFHSWSYFLNIMHVWYQFWLNILVAGSLFSCGYSISSPYLWTIHGVLSMTCTQSVTWTNYCFKLIYKRYVYFINTTILCIIVQYKC